MPSALKAVIFDHTTLVSKKISAEARRELRELVRLLKGLNIKIVVFSTWGKDIDAELKAVGLPKPDLFLTLKEVRVKKGSDRWVTAAAFRLSVQPHEMLYVGDDVLDWRTAINAATMYFHAGWTGPMPAKAVSFVAQNPLYLWFFISHYLIHPPRWEFRLDDPARQTYLRFLLATKRRLAKNGGDFELQDVFYRKQKISVGAVEAHECLMLHAICSLYLEGLIEPRATYFAVYPSHTPGKRNEVLEQFLVPVTKTFRSFYKEDLIVRAIEAMDSSEEKFKARQENRAARTSFEVQTNSVHLNPAYREAIAGRPVIVVDDFTTSGRSLEWARNLLLEAGASRVVSLAIGRYGLRPPFTHTFYDQNAAGGVLPFDLREYPVRDMFRKTNGVLQHDSAAAELIERSFQQMKEGKPLPVE